MDSLTKTTLNIDVFLPKDLFINKGRGEALRVYFITSLGNYFITSNGDYFLAKNS